MQQNALLWQAFAARYQLTAPQLEQFHKYYLLLEVWNKKMNLTAVTDEAAVLAYHFEDSLTLMDFYDVSTCNGIIDVGTGGGLPGIPLKIKFPHIHVVLVEVIQKKVAFLHEVIKELGLTGIEVSDLDWRTFLRQTDYQADLVCARASLRPDELIRMFQASSPYRHATLVYWASSDYELGEKEQQFFLQSHRYSVGEKSRRYLFFAQK